MRECAVWKAAVGGMKETRKILFAICETYLCTTMCNLAVNLFLVCLLNPWGEIHTDQQFSSALINVPTDPELASIDPRSVVTLFLCCSASWRSCRVRSLYDEETDRVSQIWIIIEWSTLICLWYLAPFPSPCACCSVPQVQAVLSLVVFPPANEVQYELPGVILYRSETRPCF